jgi:hypothetical protein
MTEEEIRAWVAANKKLSPVGTSGASEGAVLIATWLLVLDELRRIRKEIHGCQESGD